MRIRLLTPVLSALFFLGLAASPAPALGGTGDYPHLQLWDLQSTLVPPSAGPFDSTGVFQAFSGFSFEALVSYQSPGQPNTNVAYGLLVSAFQTPFPEDLTPPPLFTMPPFNLILPATPTLSGSGIGSLPLHVPAGIFGIESYVQAVIFDTTASPKLQVSNGVTISILLPDYNVSLSYLRDQPDPDDGVLDGFIGEIGTIGLDETEVNQLKPLGTAAPPVAMPTDLGLGDVRFLPLVHNVGDEPINPMARPITAIAQNVVLADDVIVVDSTAGFPPVGRLLIEQNGSDLWGAKGNGNNDPPNAEIVTYTDITATAFLNCERLQLGSNGPATGNHQVGDLAVGDFSFVTSPAAVSRSRVSTDARNVDMPHVVIPEFTFTGGDGEVTMDLDVYLFEQESNGVQGFLVVDHRTHQWRVLEDTKRNPNSGRWDPIVHVAPDGRSMIAALRTPGGIFAWDNNPDHLIAIRLDGLTWPATGTTDWRIEFELGPQPPDALAFGVKSRRIWTPFTRIVGTDPDNYVVYAGLAYKWKAVNAAGQPFQGDDWAGFEAEWLREEIVVRDVIESPLTPPGSAKAIPSSPRPLIIADFGFTNVSELITRFDPYPILSDDGTLLAITAGSRDDREDLFVVRNVSVDQNGQVQRLLVNVSGHKGTTQGGFGLYELVAFRPGGHGSGRKGAISPDNARVAWVVRSGSGATVDWLQIGRTTGVDFGSIQNAGEDDNSGLFEEPGALQNDRVISNLRWLDADRILVSMGRQPYNDPIGQDPAKSPRADLFVYTVSTGEFVNLTESGQSGGTGFATLGRIEFGGSFASTSGDFVYFVRAGIKGVGSSLPGEVDLTNVFAVNAATLDVFDITGKEFSSSQVLPDIQLPAAETRYLPWSTIVDMDFTEGAGDQAGRMYFSGHKIDPADGSDTGRDHLFAVNVDAPFVSFQVTSGGTAPAEISNVAPNPYSGTVAFARAVGPDAAAPTQHAFVVDLDNFLYERDLLPDLVLGGNFIGRVMDGSFHFVPPTPSASDALVFSFGYKALPNGIAHVATPAYYSLGAVSDPIIEPKPILLPLVATALLGLDYRYYIPSAGLFVDQTPLP